MKKITSLFIAFLLSLSLMGCQAGDSAKETFATVVDEVEGAYTNVATKIHDVSEWIDTKVTQTQETVENVQEAAEEVSEAMDSIKELTGSGDDEEEITEEEFPEESTETDETPPDDETANDDNA